MLLLPALSVAVAVKVKVSTPLAWPPVTLTSQVGVTLDDGQTYYVSIGLR